jgi:hypothetical protein
MRSVLVQAAIILASCIIFSHFDLFSTRRIARRQLCVCIHLLFLYDGYSAFWLLGFHLHLCFCDGSSSSLFVFGYLLLISFCDGLSLLTSIRFVCSVMVFRYFLHLVICLLLPFAYSSCCDGCYLLHSSATCFFPLFCDLIIRSFFHLVHRHVLRM